MHHDGVRGGKLNSGSTPTLKELACSIHGEIQHRGCPSSVIELD